MTSEWVKLPHPNDWDFTDQYRNLAKTKILGISTNKNKSTIKVYLNSNLCQLDNIPYFSYQNYQARLINFLGNWWIEFYELNEPNDIHNILDRLDLIEKIEPIKIKNRIALDFGAKAYYNLARVEEDIDWSTNIFQLVDLLKEFYFRYPVIYDKVLKKIYTFDLTEEESEQAKNKIREILKIFNDLESVERLQQLEAQDKPFCLTISI